METDAYDTHQFQVTLTKYRFFGIELLVASRLRPMEELMVQLVVDQATVVVVER